MAPSPRVLFVGDLNFYAKGHSRVEALRRFGVEVTAISHTAIGGADKGHPPFSLAFRLAWKLGVHLDTERVNGSILSAAQSVSPDVIWIEKGNMVRPATLVRLKQLCPEAVIASYSEDDMYNPLNRTLAYQRGLRHYDVVFVTKSFNAEKDELPSLGARVCITVDKAFDPEQHLPLTLTETEQTELGADVGFIGSYAPERGYDALHLAENGLRVRVWGNGWENFKSRNPNLVVEGRPLINRPDDLLYTKGINATKINLGFLRKVNRDLQTDRSVEIPACGGFMLAEASSEHARLFNDGQEAVFYVDQNDLVEKARYYLEHKAERTRIAAAGRRRCLDSGYDHDHRMRFMIDAAMKQRP